MKTAFLCKFVRFRQIFFKAYVKAFKKEDFPKEIDMTKIDGIDFIDLYDIVDL